MGAKIYRFQVSHPEYGTAIVDSVGPDSATMAACTKWGVRDLWAQLAGYCRVDKLGPAAKPRCRRCGKEYGEPGTPRAWCPECAQAKERYRREEREFQRRLPKRDRRTGE